MPPCPTSQNRLGKGVRRELFLSLEQVTLRLGSRHLLADTNWEISTGEQWAVVGPNGAGKTTLVRALAGRVPVVAGRIRRHRREAAPEAVAYVGFDVNRRLMDREERLAEAFEFSGGAIARTTVRRLLARQETDTPAADTISQFRLAPLLDLEIVALSAGEMQRVLLARAVSASPGLLILDEPFDGLDASTRDQMIDVIQGLMAQGVQTVVVAHREKDLPEGITHILRMDGGRVLSAGPRAILTATPPGVPTERAEPPRVESTDPKKTVLIKMDDVSVSYGTTTVISRLNWMVRCGEHWAITGPNGCGKSTLLGLITTENLQGYANTVELFGRRRGSGESIWDIRQKIGRVSPELQIRYRCGISAQKVVLSGFFDSLGLYRKADDRQLETAQGWIRSLGIEPLSHRPFDQLSQGEQRLMLLARAMVKAPRLLILDEPCQGLDPDNRQRILDLVDAAVARANTTLIYVTHDPEERLGCITDILAFEKTADGRYRTVRQKP
ncbi:MAG: ATP-binding cassette domain-containing protein [Desulfobacterales bacterium]|nr:ATP-binding cassette domain-containing protein [Desulfobacterales bacterium]